MERENMDYPQRNTDSEEKIWIENADSGRSGLLPLTGWAGASVSAGKETIYRSLPTGESTVCCRLWRGERELEHVPASSMRKSRFTACCSIPALFWPWCSVPEMP